MPAQSSSTAVTEGSTYVEAYLARGRRPVGLARCRRPLDLVYSGLGGTAPETVTDGRLEPAGTASVATDAPAALALLAQDAVDLLLSAEIRRVRVCGADHCALRFADRSPARNRRWCSMSRCGNRTKVRLHQARSRRSEPTAAD
ncbi:CGNR zinc finger domain-containing protein [Streptomyces griseorubiginosus]|uniref:CGNR zinc finger domain-containing protein n=1 Tax=Streptomyces griseorubiginosus TaxID=67304 RepID=UPI002E8179CB|nr:CGNR zinc finger domain-containing protein [Streptomyces griseorubiginosus]WUB42538.1 CGNR zinc finger domain-containing protein [Streptomyces griseorubiginosus]WUB51056.1 CGNR zinc finger domain-containing protein [Streptomyces griseorubiginosus]